MGFEQVIPPIPDRQAELDGIKRLEESWLNQPYYKYYMNESLRIPKMAYAERINKAYKKYWQNFSIITFCILPFTVLSKRFFVTRGSLPMTYKPDYFDRVRTDKYIRSSKYLKIMVPVHFILSIALTDLYTNWEDAFCDIKYEFLQKTPTMM